MRDIAETIKRDIAKALQPKPEKIDGDYCNSCRNFNFLPEITTEKLRRSNL